jgi:methylenetetrahydrofolate--tRNA-(uracil-5-)-methyltransferase
MKIVILGAGLAGCESAFQLAASDHSVELLECKPRFLNSEVYSSVMPAELVCSNSLKSESPSTGSYLLKQEMKIMGSVLLDTAYKCSVPAGASLAVNRAQFSESVEKIIEENGNITFRKGVVIQDVDQLKNEYPADAYIVATGPLTEKKMVDSIAGESGSFYDAIAPLVSLEGIDINECFWGSRYGKGAPDFLNIPLNKDQYEMFVNELLNSDKIPWNSIEKPEFFERCMPIEVLAERGFKTLAFGPFRPVGFEWEGRRPYAVLQLRAENSEKSVLNLVGCQTRMRQSEQKRVFRLLPGLKNAEFVRYGSVHRNSFVNSPEVLDNGVKIKTMENVYIAGQLSGVEGYNESIFSGLWAAINIMYISKGGSMAELMPPAQTMAGGMLRKLTTPASNFQPVNANFSLIDNPNILKKKERKEFYVKSGIEHFRNWYETVVN